LPAANPPYSPFKIPFRLTPYQVQFLLVGFVTVGYALYLRYLAVSFNRGAACTPLQTMCASRDACDLFVQEFGFASSR